MARITTKWDGLGGLPGYSVLYLDATTNVINPDNALARVRALWEDLVAQMPAPISYEVDPVIAYINSSDGIQEAEESGTVAAQGTFGFPGVYSAASGAVLTWGTNNFHRGHKVRGRTFIVPLESNGYQNNGTLSTAAVNALSAAAENYVTGSVYPAVPVVWARPTYQLDANGKPIKINGVKQIASPGAHYNITSGTVHDRVAILRSRRD